MDDDDDDTLIEEIDTALIVKNLKIFDRISADEAIPQGFTAATVRVDAKPASSLNWKKEAEEAEALIKNGYRICFELDFGLFGPEFKGIASQGQFQTIVLALDEFQKRLLSRFQEHVEAVILYRSSKAFASLEERDMRMDYLDLLRQELPDDIITLLLFNLDSAVQDPYTFARLFSPDRYTLFTLALTRAPLLLNCCSWNSGKALLGYIGRDISQYAPQECFKGLVLPRFTSDAQAVVPLLQALIAKNEHFKIISEDFLALEWDGLDELYLSPQSLAATTLRMVDGFVAAGGTVIIDQNPPESIK